MVRKNNDFAEFKGHRIHRKQVALIHNTVLILCDEADGLVAVYNLRARLTPAVIMPLLFLSLGGS